jgi:glycosyltransferase involved in cell wall biosynthesis
LLGDALRAHGVNAGLERVTWDENGWPRALSDLWSRCTNWRGEWALVQYTALSWSRRGLPLRFLLVLGVLRIRGVRTTVVFHDAHPYAGKRLRDRVRRVCQRLVMRWAYRMSDATVLTVPLEHVSWLPAQRSKATFIPIGANVPVMGAAGRSARNGDAAKTISVFAITEVGDISREILDIALAARRAAECMPRVRLVTLGRGSAQSESRFREALKGSSVEFSALGVLPAKEVSQVLANSDLSLCVRYPLTTQRGSAIASLANGVPLVAYADPVLPAPLAEAGIVGVRYLDSEKLAEETARVLTDPQVLLDLQARSRRAFEKYFSWGAVAGRVLEVLNHA